MDGKGRHGVCEREFYINGQQIYEPIDLQWRSFIHLRKQPFIMDFVFLSQLSYRSCPIASSPFIIQLKFIYKSYNSWVMKVETPQCRGTRERERERGASSAWWRKLRSVYLVLLLMKFYSLIPFRKIFTIFEYFSCLKVLFLASHKNLIKKKFEEDLPKKKSWLHILKISLSCNTLYLFMLSLFVSFYFILFFQKKKKILISLILL